MELVFSKYGIDIIKRDGKLFIQFDAGGIVVQFIEVEISEEEAQNAHKSEKDAYKVIIKLQNENRPFIKLKK